MYNPRQTLIQTFIGYLQNTYRSVFGHGRSQPVDLLGRVANRVLATIAQSDALYHNLEHTILVMTVGQEILQAKQHCEGYESVSAEDWLHLMIALLCHDIGYCQGVCQRDNRELRHQVTGVNNDYVVLPVGATDASLSFYHVDRSKQFVQEQFQDEALLDVDVVQQIIDRTRFPASNESLASHIQMLADLGRSADLIGQFSDRNYLQKLPALFYEFEQNGTNKTLGYECLTDVQTNLPGFYWHHVHRYVANAIDYLNYTPAGQQIVTDLYANVLK